MCHTRFGKQYLVYDQCLSYRHTEGERGDLYSELGKQILKHGKLKNSCTDFHGSLVFKLKLCQNVQEIFTGHGNV